MKRKRRDAGLGAAPAGQEEPASMDAALRKRVLRLMTYGLYVVTAAAGDDLAAGTVAWLS